MRAVYLSCFLCSITWSDPSCNKKDSVVAMYQTLIEKKNKPQVLIGPPCSDGKVTNSTLCMHHGTARTCSYGVNELLSLAIRWSCHVHWMQWLMVLLSTHRLTSLMIGGQFWLGLEICAIRGFINSFSWWYSVMCYPVLFYFNLSYSMISLCKLKWGNNSASVA